LNAAKIPVKEVVQSAEHGVPTMAAEGIFGCARGTQLLKLALVIFY
jgi:hypothetical protein